jgi:predicted peptidase
MKFSKKSLVFIFTVSLIIVSTKKSFGQSTNLNSQNGTALTIETDYKNSTIDGYNVFVPNSYNSNSKAFPIIIFLQGGLGVGGKINKIFNWALPKLLLENQDKQLNDVLDDFIYVMPHLEKDQFYNNENAIKSIINEVSKNYNIDTNRIYLTGLSRGGFGTWGLASRMPEVFSAIAPICGGSYGIKDYEALTTLPVWASHNSNDGVVNYEGTQRTVNRLENISTNKFFKANELSKVNYNKSDYIFISKQSDGHDAWTEFYTNKDLYKWFLRFKKED